MDNVAHPLADLLIRYYQEFDEFKEEHQDEAPLAFNQSYGLYIDVPSAWPWLDAVRSVVSLAYQEGDEKVVIIYSSTRSYDELSDAFYDDPRVSTRNPIVYISWHEIYTAMHMASKDSRLFKALRDKISSANLCIFVGATNAPADVVDQIRGLVEGCLIILG